jgi:hypothetical protein
VRRLRFNSEQTITPFTRTVIVGSGNSVSAPSPQSVGGESHSFGSWSDGGAANHQIVAPATATTYTVTYTPTAALPGLVAAYSMDEGTGNAVGDASGKGNTGTVTTTTWTAGGRHGSALSFNGTSSWVTVPDTTSLHLTNGMTLQAWVRPTTVTSWRTVMMKQHTSGLAYVLAAGSDTNRPHVAIHTTSEADIGAPSQLPLNTWSHLAATYDGTTLRLYVNGTQVAQTPKTGNIRSDTAPLRIGGNSIWGEYFNGLIDEVRIYNRALTTTEIQTDMNTPIS